MLYTVSCMIRYDFSMSTSSTAAAAAAGRSVYNMYGAAVYMAFRLLEQAVAK
jgi:hypothetical protein